MTDPEKTAAHGADGAVSHDAHDAHFAHTMTVRSLLTVWGALMVFTVLTVWASRQGLGSQTSFIIAMIIATVKAGLVMAVFMHLWWDKRMHVFAFLGSFLFVLLFIGMLLTDKSEYKPDIDRKIADEAAQGGK
jgi:cytochrome c oxidase subunit 4